MNSDVTTREQRLPETTWDEVEVWADLGYIARFSYKHSKEDCYWIDFEVFQITSYPGTTEDQKDSPAGEFGVAMKGWKQSSDDVAGDDLDNAEIYCKGSIKFDGCSHFYWHEYTHICGIDEAAKHCAMVYRLFLKAKAAYPEHGWLWEEWTPDEQRRDDEGAVPPRD